MNPRTSIPEAGNPFYNTRGNGGYSTCIKGSPTDRYRDVYSNCVGHACGRFNEIIGSMKYPQLNCNAENFIERAISLGLSVVSKPSLGGIMVWQKGATLSGSDGAGHVEAVEMFYDNGDVLNSASNYGGTPFYNARRNNSNGRWGLASGYTYRGCIVNPAIGYKPFEPKPTPQPVDPFPGVSDEELARRVWTGEFGNGQDRKNNLGIRYDSVQRLVDQGVGKPSQPTPSVDILELTRKTIRGDFGNGSQRKQALGEHYAAVQHQVNMNMRHGTTQWGNIRLY